MNICSNKIQLPCYYTTIGCHFVGVIDFISLYLNKHGIKYNIYLWSIFTYYYSDFKYFLQEVASTELQWLSADMAYAWNETIYLMKINKQPIFCTWMILIKKPILIFDLSMLIITVTKF